MMRRSLEILGIIAILILLTSIAQAGDWPMFQHDLSHTRYTTDPGPLTNNSLWKYETVNGVKSTPTVANGIVYIGSYDDCIYALDARTGELKWNYKTVFPIFSSPAVANDIVYVGSLDDYFYALDTETGNLKWRYKTCSSIKSSPAVANGLVS